MVITVDVPPGGDGTGPSQTAVENAYFAYGSNMDPGQMAHRGLGFHRAVGAILADHRLDFSFPARGRWLGGAADIHPEEGASVEGVLYDLVDDVSIMDDWEGGYERIPVQVMVVGSGDTRRAWAYQALVKHRPIVPSEVYVGQMLEGARMYGISERYIRMLEGHLEEGRRELGDHVRAVRVMAREGRQLTAGELAEATDRPVDRVVEVLSDLEEWSWVVTSGREPRYLVPPHRSERSPWVLR